MGALSSAGSSSKSASGGADAADDGSRRLLLRAAMRVGLVLDFSGHEVAKWLRDVYQECFDALVHGRSSKHVFWEDDGERQEFKLALHRSLLRTAHVNTSLPALRERKAETMAEALAHCQARATEPDCPAYERFVLQFEVGEYLYAEERFREALHHFDQCATMADGAFDWDHSRMPLRCTQAKLSGFRTACKQILNETQPGEEDFLVALASMPMREVDMEQLHQTLSASVPPQGEESMGVLMLRKELERRLWQCGREDVASVVGAYNVITQTLHAEMLPANALQPFGETDKCFDIVVHCALRVMKNVRSSGRKRKQDQASPAHESSIVSLLKRIAALSSRPAVWQRLVVAGLIDQAPAVPAATGPVAMEVDEDEGDGAAVPTSVSTEVAEALRQLVALGDDLQQRFDQFVEALLVRTPVEQRAATVEALVHGAERDCQVLSSLFVGICLPQALELAELPDVAASSAEWGLEPGVRRVQFMSLAMQLLQRRPKKRRKGDVQRGFARAALCAEAHQFAECLEETAKSLVGQAGGHDGLTGPPPAVAPFVARALQECGHTTHAAVWHQMAAAVDFGAAFRALQASPENNDTALYEYIWEPALLEVCVHVHSQRGQFRESDVAARNLSCRCRNPSTKDRKGWQKAVKVAYLMRFIDQFG